MHNKINFLWPWAFSGLMWFTAAPAALADCSVRTPIEPNDSVAGALDSSDCTIFELGTPDDFSFVDLYELTLPADGTLTVDMQSSTIDAFVGIADSSITTTIAADDDSGAGTNARLIVNLAAGTYVILANSFAVELGPYTLSTKFVFSSPGDFDADQDSDVLLRQMINGSWRSFEIEDFNVAANDSLSIFNSEIWTHQTNADFDGDGDVDVLIRRDDGAWRVSEVEDGMVVGSSPMSLFQNLTWQFQAAFDFDNDGDADILARKSEGPWRIFEIQDRQVVSSEGIGLFSNSLWRFQGAADYDGDGDGDVLLRRTDNGRWQIFRMQDGTLVSSAPAGALFISSSWDYVTSGDMDKDGAADIVLRHQGTGQWRVFKMVNRVVASVQALNLYTNLLWEHAQTGDFDGDGDQDLLLRKSDNSFWRIFNIENRQKTGSTAPAIWQNLNFEVKDIAPSP